MTQIRQEGQPAFPSTDTENDNSAASSAGEETTTEEQNGATTEGGADKGATTETGKKPDAPFNEHPAWKEREKTWSERFNEQEQRHQNDLQKLREEFGLGKKAAPAAEAAAEGDESEIPDWFGGTLEQWKAFEASVQTRAEKALEAREAKAREAQEAEEKAVADATDYMKSEVAAIQADKTLNPTGAKIDVNKLLKFTLENHLVDEQNRWDYRKAFRFMKAGEHTKESHAGERKKIAAAATSEAGAEKPSSTLKTREDFQKKRPW